MSEMNYTLIYELVNREYNNVLLLKTELERRGHSVEILCKDQDIRLKHKKSIVLLPNSSHEEDINAYRYNFNLKNNTLVIYPCEQVINGKLSEDFDYSEKNPLRDIPILCWGEEYHELMKSVGMNSDKLYKTGAIQLDYCRKEFQSFYAPRQEIAEKYNLPIEKKWLLFISDFTLSDDKYADMLKKSPACNSDEIIVAKAYEEEVQTIILDWFEQLLLDDEEYVIIYRKHPTEVKIKRIYEIEKKYPQRFLEISELNIKQWIAVCDKITNYNSTATIESTVFGKPVLLLRPKEFPKESGMKEYGFFKNYPHINTYQLFFERLKKSNEEDINIILNNIKQFYDIDQRPAFMRVADALEEIGHNFFMKKIGKNYTLKRILFLMRTSYMPKRMIKQLYRFYYSLTGWKPSKETSVTVKEWFGYVDFRRTSKEKEIILKSILCEFF